MNAIQSLERTHFNAKKGSRCPDKTERSPYMNLHNHVKGVIRHCVQHLVIGKAS